MSFWVFIYRIAWIFLVALISIGIFSLFYPQYRQHQAYTHKREILQEEIRLQQELIESLKIKQERFQRDPKFVEHLAHEWGLAKPDETIFKFENERLYMSTNDAGAAAP